VSRSGTDVDRRYDLKLCIGDLHEGVACLPHWWHWGCRHAGLLHLRQGLQCGRSPNLVLAKILFAPRAREGRL